MKNRLPTAVFLLATAGLMTVGVMTMTTAQVSGPFAAPWPNLPGIDVSVSAVAAGTGGSRAINVYNSAATSASLPSDSIAMTLSTTSCNVQPNNNGYWSLSPGGGPIPLEDQYVMSPSAVTYPVGNVTAQWFAGWDGATGGAGEPPLAWGARHPYIAQNVFRLNSEGRLEQLAASWVKHGWSAAEAPQGAVAGANGQPACGSGSCSFTPSDDELGAGCSDTYGAGLNAAREWLGPRTEINARGTWNNPGWSLVGSWLDNMNYATNTDTPGGQGDGVRSYSNSGTAQAWKLNQVRVSEFVGASKVYLESYYAVNGDNYKLNNFAYRRHNHTITGSTLASAVTSSSFTQDGPHTFGPAMLSWGDRQTTSTPVTEGFAYGASRVVQVAPGQWRYEYNVYNVDIDREINKVEIPVPSFANITNVGFWQPRHSAPGYHGFTLANPQSQFTTNTAWTSNYDLSKGALAFTPPTPNPGTLPNTIRWGTMYTFWFTCDLPPRCDAGVTLAPRRAGTLTAMTLPNLQAPRNPADIANTDGDPGSDGTVDNGDFTLFFSAFFAPTIDPLHLKADIADTDGLPQWSSNPALRCNLVGDNTVDNGDFTLFFSAFFGG